ncbi:GDP-L-fucose synthase family protein [Mangrovibacterium diazotrophicum]|uniref:GDP-L-fucose synthase n=1 Tax=Mangrovibacterium diazotrophicum TaxID=1261403 RepID=A0A419VVL9_9BACT|nr:GDP-L-fucose synthase [Mangrovibacterium diazotrophicum]RKD86207.1 GDP-L-fucose synthase [Mangrovibacterium diazotrophicum]
MEKNSKIYIAGHRGLVGSAILKGLKEKGYTNFVTKTHKELDLSDQLAVAKFFEEENPDYVFLAAAKVGGIMANNVYRGQFIYENLMIQNNVIHQAYLNNVKKLLFLGSTCIYPREAPQPMPEDSLLTSPLEYTNEPYAVAKITGIKMCESYNIQYGTNFISVMPTNLYGPNDNFDLEKSHVLPALIRKIYLGKCLSEDNWDAILDDLEQRPVESIDNTASKDSILGILEKYGIKNIDGKYAVEIWGTGNPMREFLWSEDMAAACIFVMENINFEDVVPKNSNEIRNTHINIGTGKEISIRGLAELIKAKVGFDGDLYFNRTKPDGTMRKLTDPSKLHGLGWKHSVEIEDGIESMIKWYTSNVKVG